MSVMFGKDGAPPPPFPAVLRWFHWITAALLALMFVLAWSFEWLGPSETGVTLVDLHRSFGLLILAVVVARALWRLTHRLEPLPHNSPAWERVLAATVQGALYLALLAMPLIGWTASMLSGETVRFFGWALPDLLPMDEDRSDRLFALHGLLGWVIIGLVGLHVAGALRHHFIKRDGLLHRMRPW